MLKPNSNFNGISVSFVTNYDCNLACKYDLAKGTKVLMSDFTYKNIEDVKIGDKIIAFDEFPVKNEELDTVKYIDRHVIGMASRHFVPISGKFEDGVFLYVRRMYIWRRYTFR